MPALSWFMNIGALATSVVAIVWIADTTRDLAGVLVDQGRQIEAIEQTLGDLPLERVPANATVLEVECIPVDTRLLIAGNTAYDVCGRDLTIFVEDVLTTRLDLARGHFSSPRTIALDESCELQLLSIPPAEAEARRAEVRIRCRA